VPEKTGCNNIPHHSLPVSEERGQRELMKTILFRAGRIGEMGLCVNEKVQMGKVEAIKKGAPEARERLLKFPSLA